MQEPTPNPGQYDLDVDEILSEAWNLSLDLDFTLLAPLFLIAGIFAVLVPAAYYFPPRLSNLYGVIFLLAAGIYFCFFLNLCAQKISIEIARMKPMTFANAFSVIFQPVWPLVKRCSFSSYRNTQDQMSLVEDEQSDSVNSIWFGWISRYVGNPYTYLIGPLAVDSTYPDSEIRLLAIKAARSQWLTLLKITFIDRIISSISVSVLIGAIFFIGLYLYMGSLPILLIFGLIFMLVAIQSIRVGYLMQAIVYRELFDRNFFTMHVVASSPEETKN